MALNTQMWGRGSISGFTIFLLFVLLVLGIASLFIKNPQNVKKPVDREFEKYMQLEGGTAVNKEAEDTGVLKAKISDFYAAEKRYPSSLRELFDKKYIDALPEGVNYDPKTGDIGDNAGTE
jgi:hypothetical protein